MNTKCFKVIFNHVLMQWVAVSEIAPSRTKTARKKTSPKPVAGQVTGVSRCSTSPHRPHKLSQAIGLLLSMSLSGGAFALSNDALPTGSQVQTGSVAISQTGATMQIDQTSAKASVNWQSFSVGRDAQVTIAQPDARAVLLNRVVGADVSEIHGRIQANGQIILVNPNGVLIGRDGSVHATAFTASTFALSDDDFAAGRYHYVRQANSGDVVNQGEIVVSGEGAYVALIGAKVDNQGRIVANGGDVIMSSATGGVSLGSEGESIIGIPLSRRVVLEVDANAFSAQVSNSGEIISDGGHVLLRAGAIMDAVSHIAQAQVTHMGQIDTTGEQGGRVDILADQGTVRVSGSVSANSTNGSAGGDIFIGRDEDTNVLAAVGDASGAQLESLDGFVETSGEYLVTRGTRVRAAEWLLDPTDINIVGADTAAANTSSETSSGTITFQDTGNINASEVLASDIEAAINAGTNVTITTVNSSATGAGNITLASALTFDNNSGTNATLRLLAENGITQEADASISATGSSLVHIVMDGQGRFQGLDADHASSRGITLNSSITTTGNVTISGINRSTNNGFTQSGVVFNNNSGITANTITVSGQKTTASATNESNGVAFNGSNTFVSVGDSVINGTSTSGGVAGAGVFLNDSAVLNIDSGAGSFRVVGAHATTTVRGVRLGLNNGSSRINTNGNVTFESSTANVFLRSGLTVHSGAVTLRGVNGANAILFVNASITGNNGTTVNLEGSLVEVGQSGKADLLVSAGNSFNLNIKANRLSVSGTSVINTGTSGLVNITTLTPDRNISIGTVTGDSTRLDIDAGALNAMTAQRVVIGDTTSQGNISVDQATTTNANMGHLILQTGGNIAINAGLNVGTRNLTLNATGATSVVTQTGVITATGLELRGLNATYTLNLPSNSISTLAADTHTLSLANTGPLSVGVVNSTIGLRAVNSIDVSSTTSLLNQSAIWVLQAVRTDGGAISLTGTNTATTGTSAASFGIRLGNLATIGSASSGPITLTASSIIDSGYFQAGGTVLTSPQKITVVGTGVTGLNINGNLTSLASATDFGGLPSIEMIGSGTSNGIVFQGVLNNNANNASTLLQSNAGALITKGTITVNGALTLNSPGTISGSGSITSPGVVTFNTGAGTGLYSGVLGGAGSFVKEGAGTTVLSANQNYLGTTTVNQGTLQIGDDGTTGTLGMGSVSVANGSTLTIRRSDAVHFTQSIGGTGNLFATSSGGGITLSNLSLTGNLLTQAAGNISVTNTHPSAGTLNFSARTTANNGSVEVSNTGGTLHVITVNGVSGIVTHGTGDVTLSGSQTGISGSGLRVTSAITANNGNVVLTGITSSATAFDAGVLSQGAITANNITVTGTASSTSGNILGFYGAGGVLQAAQVLTVTGSSASGANGLYSFGGSFVSGEGMHLTGTSTSGNALGLEANVSLVNGSTGGITLNATSTNTSLDAILLSGVDIRSDGGAISLIANSGHINVNEGLSSWGLGTLTNTITQNGNGNVLLQTQGTGNITVPIIVNNGTGNVTVAAGSNLSAGTAIGGQVLTVSGNSITQNSTGKTYIYSGALADTGNLSFLNTDFANLYYQGASNTLNTQFGVAYGDGGSHTGALSNTVQVRLRESVGASNQFVLDLASQSKTYGDADPSLKLTDNSALPTTITRVVGSNTLAIATADLGISRVSGANVSDYNYTVASGMNASLGGAKLSITKRDITIDTIDVAAREYDGTTNATFTGATFNNLVGSETLLLSGTGVFDSNNVDDVSEVTSLDFGSLNQTNGTGSWANYNLLTTFTAQPASLKITPRALTASALNESVAFNGQEQIQTVQLTGLVSGDDVIIAGAASGTVAGTYQSNLSLAPNGATLLSNYDITYVNAAFIIQDEQSDPPTESSSTDINNLTPVFDFSAPNSGRPNSVAPDVDDGFVLAGANPIGECTSDNLAACNCAPIHNEENPLSFQVELCQEYTARVF